MPERTPIIQSKKTEGHRFKNRYEKKARSFYQTHKWKNFRKSVKTRQRSIDESRIHDLYNTMKSVTFQSLIAWINDEKQNPLCAHCLEEKKIRAGNVADHIDRIRAGGSAFDRENIQFLCAYHHNQKSGRESHEN